MPLSCTSPDLGDGHAVRGPDGSLDAWFANLAGALAYARGRRGTAIEPAPAGLPVPSHGWSVVDCHVAGGRPRLVRRSWYAERPGHVDPNRLHDESVDADPDGIVALRVAAMAARERARLAEAGDAPVARDRARRALSDLEAAGAAA